MKPRGVLEALLLTTIVAGASACAEAEPRAAFTVDTLTDGFVVVANARRSGALRGVREEWRLGSSDPGPELISRLGGLEAHADGRIWLVDSQVGELRAFGPGGEHLWTAGRVGDGPGELRAPTSLELDGAGRLWVAELGNQRYSVFDTTGTFVDVHPRRVIGTLSPWQGAFASDGSLVEGGVGIGDDRVTYRAAFRRLADGTLVDTLRLPSPEREYFDLPTDQFVVAVPWQPDLAWTPAAAGGVWTADTGEYRLVRRTLAGDSLFALELGVDRVPVLPAERDTMEAYLSGIGRGEIRPQFGRIPDFKPPLTAIREAEDGTLWVRLPVPWPADSTAFDRFSPEGRHLDRIGIPFELGDRIWLDGDVIVGTTESALGEPQVVRLRLDPAG